MGYTKEELLTMRFQDVTFKEDINTELAYIKQLLQGDISFYEMQKRFIHKDGFKVWVNLSTALIRDERNEPKYFVSVIQDVTALKEATKKLHEKEEMMIAQSRQAAMGEMIESIAHQWRQPLNIIGSATANLETEYTLGLMDEKKFHNIMEIISLNINYMSETIDDFRNFLNPDKKVKNFNPKESIQAIFTILEVQLRNKKITYILKSNDNLLFNGVENEFKQVLLILLSNTQDAIKMQIEKKCIEKGEIIISLSSQDNQGIIEICDNGGGIDIDKIDSIFEPYFTTKSNEKGTGIGLYIAKNIINNRMKGSLSVKNTESGCCFTITIPLAKKTEI